VLRKALELRGYMNYFSVFLAVRGEQNNFHLLFVTDTYELIEVTWSNGYLTAH